jgi:hypothetical protein
MSRSEFEGVKHAVVKTTTESHIARVTHDVVDAQLAGRFDGPITGAVVDDHELEDVNSRQFPGHRGKNQRQG